MVSQSEYISKYIYTNRALLSCTSHYISINTTLNMSSWHECSVTSLANVLPTDTRYFPQKILASNWFWIYTKTDSSQSKKRCGETHNYVASSFVKNSEKCLEK